MNILLDIPSLPLFVGAQPSPRNPAGLPTFYPFRLGSDPVTGGLCQIMEPELSAIMRRAYDLGQEIGIGMDDTSPIARLYTEDFLAFVTAALDGDVAGRRGLEIGAGRGYLTRRLMDAGMAMTAIEPGHGYADSWARHRVEVVCDYFPSAQVPGPFDVIAAFSVLEHLPKPGDFLAAARDHLAADGHLILAVPDCEAFLAAGDPAILVHEHVLYLTRGSLVGLMSAYGFQVESIGQAGWPGALYVHARRTEMPAGAGHPSSEAAELFVHRLQAALDRLHGRLTAAAEAGRTIGIYVPSRAINALHMIGGSQPRLRFFDDEANLHGRFYPGFSCPVENFEDLCREPTDEVWVMSRSFWRHIAARLADVPNMADRPVLGWDALFSD